ncbi:MAG: hypothetical protein WCO68_05905 [Verrucomicrobiota bacterium]
MCIHSAIRAAFLVLTLCTVTAFADGPVPERCVVSGDRFADHNHAPIQVTYQGRTMAVCCKGCERKFHKDPEKYIKLYDEALKAMGGNVAAPASK